MVLILIFSEIQGKILFFRKLIEVTSVYVVRCLLGNEIWHLILVVDKVERGQEKYLSSCALGLFVTNFVEIFFQ